MFDFELNPVAWFIAVQVKEIVKPGCPGEVLKAALCSMASVTEILNVMSAPAYRGNLSPF